MTRKKEIIFGAITIVLSLVVMEVVFRYFINYHNRIGLAEKKSAFEPYQGQPWAEQFFADIDDCGRQTNTKGVRSYARYVLYDINLECKTVYVNYVGGVRKTWSPVEGDIPRGTPVRTVAFFGGSTVEGTGVIDDETIPSWFSKILNASSSAWTLYRVTNYGMSGYTHTQALLKLILLLREGKRFDHVIFYDGANDIENAYQEGIVGALYQERMAASRFEGDLTDRFKEFFMDQVNGCGVCKAVVILSRNTPVLKDALTPFLVRVRGWLLFQKGKEKDEAGIARFAAEIADYYRKSHNVLDALAAAYGFRYAEFWQPTLHYDDSPVAGERILLNIDSRVTDQKLRALYRAVRADMNAMALDNFYDVAGVLGGRQKAYYLDSLHVSGEANGVIAREIARVFAEHLVR